MVNFVPCWTCFQETLVIFGPPAALITYYIVEATVRCRDSSQDAILCQCGFTWKIENLLDPLCQLYLVALPLWMFLMSHVVCACFRSPWIHYSPIYWLHCWLQTEEPRFLQFDTPARHTHILFDAFARRRAYVRFYLTIYIPWLVRIYIPWLVGIYIPWLFNLYIPWLFTSEIPDLVDGAFGGIWWRVEHRILRVIQVLHASIHPIRNY